MASESEAAILPSNTSDGPPHDNDFVMAGQTMLILCGLIASGKSTFAEALQQHFPLFRRCNQDDLGDRRRVEQLARDTLAQGQSACVDRTNFNAAQRSYWIEIANEFPQIAIWVIVFDTPYEVCAERLRTRENHPTITSVELGLDVLSRFSADFEQPYPNEGYHRIIRLKPEKTPAVYSRSDVAAILREVQDSPVVLSTGPRFRSNQRGGQRGGFNSSYRGGGGNRGNRGGYRGGYTPGHQPQQPTRGRGSGPNAGSPSSPRGRQTLSNRGNETSALEAERGPALTSSDSQTSSSEIGARGTGSIQDPLQSVQGENKAQGTDGNALVD